ncbi:DUF3857 domain-containing protein [Acanthopleuribacter pedis]
MLGTVLLFSHSAHAGELREWAFPFWQGDPQTLIQAAQAQHAANPEDVSNTLWSEQKIVIDHEGRRTTVFRRTYFINSHQQLGDLETVEASWRPWYQARPVIRARVITPDGAVHELNESDIVESAAADSEENQFNEDPPFPTSVSAPLSRRKPPFPASVRSSTPATPGPFTFLLKNTPNASFWNGPPNSRSPIGSIRRWRPPSAVKRNGAWFGKAGP